MVYHTITCFWQLPFPFSKAKFERCNFFLIIGFAGNSRFTCWSCWVSEPVSNSFKLFPYRWASISIKQTLCSVCTAVSGINKYPVATLNDPSGIMVRKKSKNHFDQQTSSRKWKNEMIISSKKRTCWLCFMSFNEDLGHHCLWGRWSHDASATHTSRK